MPETGENVAVGTSRVGRADQDAFALRSQQRARRCAGRTPAGSPREIVPVTIPQKKGKDLLVVDRDEHPRADTSLEALAKLPTPFRAGGTVTAGNASGVNDGAAALIVASEAAAKKHGLDAHRPHPRRVSATAGVPPRIMGMGPAPATRKLCARLGLAPTAGFRRRRTERSLSPASRSQFLRELGIADDAPHVNANGGAIAAGSARSACQAPARGFAGTAALELSLTGKRRALAAMCIGVGQGIAIGLERI